MEDFLFWWSVVSTILGVLFLIANVAQLVAYLNGKNLIQKEKEIHKGQVKVWQHHAKGIEMALFVLNTRTLDSVEDYKTSLEAIRQGATTLHVSLNEERLFSDEEVKAKQLEKEEEMKNLLSSARD